MTYFDNKIKRKFSTRKANDHEGIIMNGCHSLGHDWIPKRDMRYGIKRVINQ